MAVASVGRLQVDFTRCRLLRSRRLLLAPSCPASLCIGLSHHRLCCRCLRRNSPEPRDDGPRIAWIKSDTHSGACATSYLSDVAPVLTPISAEVRRLEYAHGPWKHG